MSGAASGAATGAITGLIVGAAPGAAAGASAGAFAGGISGFISGVMADPCEDIGNVAKSGAISGGISGVFAGAGAMANAGSYGDDLLNQAKQLYPKKANLPDELHHVWPKYIGGSSNGPTVPLNPAYHQLITNEFRSLWPYGQGVPSSELAHQIMKKVYSKFPLSW